MDQVPGGVEQVVQRIGDWFLGDQGKLGRVRLFTERGRQVEKWFTGELMYCLDGLREEGLLTEWHPEVTLPEWWGPRRKVDFWVRCGEGQVALIEVKDLLIGKQTKRVWRGREVQVIETGEFRLQDYIGNGCDGWLLDTAHRLHDVRADPWKMILAFAHRAVSDAEITDLTGRLNDRLPAHNVELLRAQRSQDDTLSIVWLKVS